MSKRQPPGQTQTCASCGVRRGNVRAAWHFINRSDAVVGATCPACPTWSEPIRRESSGRYLAVVSGSPAADGKRKQLKRRFDQLGDARAWVTETRSGVSQATTRRGVYADPSRMTLRALCAAWIAARAAEVGTPGGLREVTLNGYRSALDAPLRHLGDQPAREVTPGQIETCLRALATEGGKWKRPLSHRSLIYSLGSLRQAFAHGVREGWLLSNPAALARAPKASHAVKAGDDGPAVLRWTPVQLSAFREYVDAQYGQDAAERFAAWPWAAAGMRLTLAGLRRSEVLGLDWSRVALDAGTVQIGASRVKTGRGSATALGEVKSARSLRTVQVEEIHPGTVRALRALWLLQGRPETGLVICDAAGQPVQPDAFSRRFKVLCASAGVPVLRSVHNVRHTLATALSTAGVPDHEAAALLGHDVATYRRFYLVTDDDGAASAAAVAGRLFAIG